MFFPPETKDHLSKSVEVPAVHGFPPQLYLGHVVEAHDAVPVFGGRVPVGQLILGGGGGG